MMNYIGPMIGFTIANFVWEAFHATPNWSDALKISFFQASAVGYLWFAASIR